MTQTFFSRAHENIAAGGHFFTEHLPLHITANGFSCGGEIIQFIKPQGARPLITLVLTDGTRTEIRTQEEARQAIELVSQENQRIFENILIRYNIIQNRPAPQENEEPIDPPLFEEILARAPLQANFPFNQREVRAPLFLEAQNPVFAGSSNGRSISISQTLPRVVVNGTVLGGEKIEIVISRGKPPRGTLIFENGTRQNIRTQAEAQQALRRVLPGNHLHLQRALIEHRLLASSLEELIANNPKIKKLYLKINKLRDHALSLAEPDPERSSAGVALADNFQEKANQFLTHTLDNAPTEEEFAQFKEEFEALADSTETLLGRHRAIWKPIIANILLALTGIGAILIIGKLIYKATIDPANMTFNKSFFFAQTKLEYTKNQLIQQVNSDLQATIPMAAAG